MTLRERILERLRSGEAICDDCLARELRVSRRQAVNSACRELKSSEQIERRKDVCRLGSEYKYVNVSHSRDTVASVDAAPTRNVAASNGEKPWFWEGNVQARLVEHLQSIGWQVTGSADTESRQHGKDVIATSPDGREMWLTVKGYPQRSCYPQARHWFAAALFDLILYRETNSDVDLGLVLPRGFSTYANLARKVESFRHKLGFQIFWTTESGGIVVE